MSWREALAPVRMRRIAVAAPQDALGDVLALVADAGCVDLDGAAGIEECADHAVIRDGVAVVAGWTPAQAVDALSLTLATAGGAVVPLPHPPGAEAPSLLRGQGLRGSVNPLVETYGTVPYADVDPAPPAALAYVLMFGMMFGDAGHGLMLLAVAAMLHAGWPARLTRFRGAWPFVAGAGLASILFGLLYGEFFGPTGLVPVLWLDPMSHPASLLLLALSVGALLLGGAYLLGGVNRWREGGLPLALYSPAGIAGGATFIGMGVAAGGWYLAETWLTAAGLVTAVTGLGLILTGFLAEGGGLTQAVIRSADVVIRIGANVASFARLAAFGLTHAAIGWIVWKATLGLWPTAPAFAALVFTAGTLLAFALEALVAAVQALRLEYYELFSRIFQAEGRPFRPLRIPLPAKEAPRCPFRHGEGSSPSARLFS
ncbi:hypothetical protein OG884_16855 [Streptosporangium sp. NBC_01755]|uniref:V-type ATPase 116kDa subunit family protein n=1 Tax=Streptosporangium sp. NBC_01755 TaxID=2975949 RepID=UPI002DD9232C|nr:V-type ATPase 116kDa subunit family protein [Streptosporangium sp. NBC_01755]WSD03488.1 hypothetical protein OG884_16855 [Streptosporangium sp. NBC_01755]